jgi:hypothetical protein
MSERVQTRRKYLTVNAIDPETGKTLSVLVSYDHVIAVGKRSQGQAKECAYLVPMILQRPTAIFTGLCEDQDEPTGRGFGWTCYCGIPDRAYNTDGTERKVWPGEVFLVFVTDDKIAYNWRWEKADSADKSLPQRHGTRFEKRLM